MKTLKFFVLACLIFVGCKTVDPGVSYTPIYKSEKGLKQTFILDKKELIWVMNFTQHCLPILPDMEISFTKEMPYKRFVTTSYLVSELRGYDCDGDFAILIPTDSKLVGLLRTQYIRSIKVKTIGRGALVVSTTKISKRIFDDIAKLDWKTPIPKIEEYDSKGNIIR